MEELILTKRFNINGANRIDVYLQTGGYHAARKALLETSPQDVIDEVKKSNLRGRGGAGFPTGVKWGFIPKGKGVKKYLCVNGDEGEPGAFKDRYLMEKDPHLLIEGIIIASYAIGANLSFIYVRGEFIEAISKLESAVGEAYRYGFLGKDIMGSGFNLDIIIHRGAGAYICGEETALIESLEGKRGYPRLKPPFPATRGLYDCPTVVNNVETIACIPSIINHGGEWFASLGCEKNGGTKLYGLSGHIKRPGIYELPMGINLRELIYKYGMGLRDGSQLKAVIPGGSSTPVLKADEIDVKMDFDSMAKAGSMLGTGCAIVIDQKTCMVKLLLIISRFYAHESCGQCTPCREGTGWIHKIIKRIGEGKGREEDLQALLDISDNMIGKTICPLADAAVFPVRSFISKFGVEFEEHIRRKGCYCPH